MKHRKLFALLTLFACMIALALALAACGPDGEDSVTPGPLTPERRAGVPAFYLFLPLADLTRDLHLLRNVLAAVGVAAVVVSAGVGALAARGVLRPLRQARTAAQDGMVAGQSLGRGSVTGSGSGSLGPYVGEIGFRSPTSPEAPSC